jgi:hypothetical protein
MDISLPSSHVPFLCAFTVNFLTHTLLLAASGLGCGRLALAGLPHTATHNAGARLTCLLDLSERLVPSGEGDGGGKWLQRGR